MENKEKFMALCEDALPVIRELQVLAEKHGIKKNLSLYLTLDGSYHLEGCFEGWDLANYGGKPKIRYEYNEVMKLSKEEGEAGE